MCEPATVTMVMAVAGGAMSYMQQREQGKQAQSAANYNAASSRINAANDKAEADYRASVDDQNAKRAQFMAEDSIARGNEAQADERLRGRLLVGQMRAVMAGNGVQIDGNDSSGSLIIDQQKQNAKNTESVGNNAAREAEGFRIQAEQFEQNAKLTRIGGANAVSSGERDAQSLERNGQIAKNEANNNATSSLINSAGSVASKWYTFKKDGAFGSTTPKKFNTGGYSEGVWT